MGKVFTHPHIARANSAILVTLFARESLPILSLSIDYMFA